MSKVNNFISDFQRDHSQLLKLITSLGKTIKASNFSEAKDILDEITVITNGHFSFEETYLYPRLRRLVVEITNNLGHEQETMRDFINKSRNLLDKDKLSKNDSSSLLNMLPQLSKTLTGCNDLVFLAEKFNKEDKEDLNIRFTECRKTTSKF